MVDSGPRCFFFLPCLHPPLWCSPWDFCLYWPQKSVAGGASVRAAEWIGLSLLPLATPKNVGSRVFSVSVWDLSPEGRKSPSLDLLWHKEISPCFMLWVSDWKSGCDSEPEKSSCSSRMVLIDCVLISVYHNRDKILILSTRAHCSVAQNVDFFF